MVIAVILAGVAAVGFAGGTVVQHLSAEAVEHPALHHRTQHGLFGLLAGVARQPRWWLGQALTGVATALETTALAFAPVAVVGPVVAAGLPVALVIEVAVERRRPAPARALGALMCLGGLAMFIVFAQPGAARHVAGLRTGGLLLGLGLGLALATRFASTGPLGSLLAGACSGAALGTSVVATSITLHSLSNEGIAATVTSWTPYLAAVMGLLATAATQQAYARGELAWSLPALTVSNTLASTALSVTVLGAPLDAGRTAGWAAGGALALLGVVLVSLRGAALPGEPG